jgi:sirohydrochlorin ferrochelatase
MPSTSKSKPEKPAIVLIAHGSRNASANADAFYFGEKLRDAGLAHHLEVAFLELAEPTIATAVSRCLQTGPGMIVLLPYFLSAGVHVRRDLTEMCREFEMANPELTFVLAEPFGRHELLTSVLMERLREAIG